MEMPAVRDDDDVRQPGAQFVGGFHYNAEDAEKFRAWMIREGWAEEEV